MTKQQESDHNRYMANREARIAQQREYYQEYVLQGRRKPRKGRQPRNRDRDHQRYVEKREQILAQQAKYRQEHKEEIRERRRKRNFERVYRRQLNV